MIPFSSSSLHSSVHTIMIQVVRSVKQHALEDSLQGVDEIVQVLYLTRSLWAHMDCCNLVQPCEQT